MCDYKVGDFKTDLFTKGVKNHIRFTVYHSYKYLIVFIFARFTKSKILLFVYSIYREYYFSD